ncbi:DUF5709 domain-containing protein [Mycolicibacterium iranicum]|uniref:DUF5709 domain-containing protein n=1 Tax=Mycolicibacterium iranicum TaxID=912594 RepID=A0A178LYK0_MYCIR|nr:DUF5709 domain-containing protein [Mycolicibacterium iranicum]OAN39880.1 hypothetical protein A4X20_16135 [Mycolicibacterium iranicum]
MDTSTFAPGPGEYSTDEENQLPAEDTLIDRGVADALDEGYSPSESSYFRTASDPEVVDPAARLNVLYDVDEEQRSDAAEREAEFPLRREVGMARAGRLVAPDLGFGEDTEAEMVASDVGLSGGAASAEEAAVHVIDDE